MGPWILIEGLEYAGKSTLTERLQERFASVIVQRDCLCPDNPIAPLASQSTGYEAACLRFAAHLWDLRNLPPHRQGTILQDGCWLRHKASDRRKGTGFAWDDSPAPQFDAVIFLTASISVRQWRCKIRQRKTGPREEWVMSHPDQFLALEHHLRKEIYSQPNVLEIDTSALNAEQTLNQAWQYLGCLEGANAPP